MAYRKIEQRIWADEKFRRLSHNARYMFLYLLTGPHSTAWGAYVLDDLYISADLSFPPAKIKQYWKELLDEGLILRDSVTRLVAFPNWFKFNRPKNDRSAMAIINGLLSLPKSPTLSIFYNTSLQFSELLANSELMSSEMLAGEQDQKQKQEQDPPMVPPISGDTREQLTPEDLVTGWNELVAVNGVPHVSALTPERRQKTLARIKTYPELPWWQAVFDKILASRFLMGKAPPSPGRDKPFRITFGWLMENNENPTKVYEGHYDR